MKQKIGPLLADAIGKITPPPSGYADIEQGGLGNFLNNILKLITTVAGLFALFNFIMAGFSYMSANGDEKKVQQASTKIWQSLLGLGIVAASFLLAALAGWIFFKDPTFIINPKIYGPGQWTRQDTKIPRDTIKQIQNSKVKSQN